MALICWYRNYDFLSFIGTYYILILYHLRDVISYFSQFKKVT